MKNNIKVKTNLMNEEETKNLIENAVNSLNEELKNNELEVESINDTDLIIKNKYEKLSLLSSKKEYLFTDQNGETKPFLDVYCFESQKIFNFMRDLSFTTKNKNFDVFTYDPDSINAFIHYIHSFRNILKYGIIPFSVYNKYRYSLFIGVKPIDDNKKNVTFIKSKIFKKILQDDKRYRENILNIIFSILKFYSVKDVNYFCKKYLNTNLESHNEFDFFEDFIENIKKNKIDFKRFVDFIFDVDKKHGFSEFNMNIVSSYFDVIGYDANFDKKDVMQILLQSGKYSYFDLINFNKNYAKSIPTDSVEFLENFLRLKNRI